jgi:hypothetical protein
MNAGTSAFRAAITGVHCYVPPDVLTNTQLAQMVDTTDVGNQAAERTGILGEIETDKSTWCRHVRPQNKRRV